MVFCTLLNTKEKYLVKLALFLSGVTVHFSEYSLNTAIPNGLLLLVSFLDIISSE